MMASELHHVIIMLHLCFCFFKHGLKLLHILAAWPHIKNWSTAPNVEMVGSNNFCEIPIDGKIPCFADLKPILLGWPEHARPRSRETSDRRMRCGTRRVYAARGHGWHCSLPQKFSRCNIRKLRARVSSKACFQWLYHALTLRIYGWKMGLSKVA